MHKNRKDKPENVWSWMPLFYLYYTMNGQTSLDNDKYPEVRLETVREHFERTSLEQLGRAPHAGLYLDRHISLGS